MNRFFLHVISMLVYMICMLVFWGYAVSPATWWSLLIFLVPGCYIQGLITKDLFERFGQNL